MNTITMIGLAVLIVLAAAVLFVLLKKNSGGRSLFKAGQEAKTVLDQARSESDRLINDAQQKARQKLSSVDAEL